MRIRLKTGMKLRTRTEPMNFPFYVRAFVLAGAIAVTGFAGAAEKETFELEDLFRLRAVTSVEVSPDGREIAYLLRVPRNPLKDENGPPFSELHVANAEGESRPFVTGKVDVEQIAWHPDGKQISFVTKRENDKQQSLYIIPVGGGEARKILEHETGISAYSWSPNGDRVVFLASEPELEEDKKLKEKGFNQEIYEETAQFTRIWIASVEGETDETPRKLDVEGSASEVHWAPEGDRLAVAIAPTPLVDDSLMRRVVQIIDVETGAVSARLDHAAKLGGFGWSPDARHLFTISGADMNDPRDGRLFIWQPDGTKVREIRPGYEGHIWSADWKDAEAIVFVGYENLQTIVAEASIQSDDVRVRVGKDGPIADGISVSRDGKTIAFSGETPSHPAELFALMDGKDSAERVTFSNSWLSDIRLAEQEAIRFKARDGLELDGVLVRPLDYEEGKRYPLILVVHGGPEFHFSNSWLTSYAAPAQVAAARGFALFYPNYRGSTGRGVEFSRLSQGDPAGKEFEDLIDAVDHLVAIGLVDKEKVGITGGSYGGYASAWGATFYSERFAASVMFVGISDWVSAFGTTDIPNEMYHVHFNKWVWEHRDFFFERSPLAHVQKHKTPLLILHGKDDPRVHPSQSLELYRYLKVLGQAPVRLVLYPGEGHGNRKAAAQLDYAARLLRWMQHYLQGPGGEPPPHRVHYSSW